MPQVFLV